MIGGVSLSWPGETIRGEEKGKRGWVMIICTGLSRTECGLIEGVCLMRWMRDADGKRKGMTQI